MAMPKTSMYENDFAEPRKNKIWIARQFTIVQAIAKSHAMHKPPNCHFGLGIHRADPAHSLASLSRRQRIH